MTPASLAAPPPALSPARARRRVAEIAERYFGQRPRRLLQRSGGLTNLVFEFSSGGADYIVRLHTLPGKITDYQKEQWAMRAARDAGVPTPEVLEVDNAVGGTPYMIARKVAGVEATRHPRRFELIAELGRIAARLHTVRTAGHGPVFDWSSNRLSKCASWAEFLDQTLRAQQRIALLRRLRMLNREQAEKLTRTVKTMREWRNKPPVLHHGDLRLKNLIVAPHTGRVVALIDWESCLSGPAPYWDLSIALHDLNVDEKEALLDGYGIAPRAYEQAVPFLRALNVMNYAAAVELFAAEKKAHRLAWYRARLQGCFDLYL